MQKLTLTLPDRFESLEKQAKKLEFDIKPIIVPIEPALEHIDTLHVDLVSAGRGAFLIFHGKSGSGKSTFLHTIDRFRENVVTYTISSQIEIKTFFQEQELQQAELRIIVIEGREAFQDVTIEVLETSIHAINSFIRSEKGEQTLVVWMCNTQELGEKLTEIAKKVGGNALLGTDDPVYQFFGPSANQFVTIAKKTISSANQGASLNDFGISDKQANILTKQAETIGEYIGLLRKELNNNQKHFEKLLRKKEQLKMWIVVIAGNNQADRDVAALTRGNFSSVDIDRMMSVTKANITKELHSSLEKLGFISTTLDVKILFLPITTVLSTIRLFASDELKKMMSEQKARLKSSKDDPNKLANTDLARAFQNLPSEHPFGKPPGSTTKTAFDKLLKIAFSNDHQLNDAIGSALTHLSLIDNFKTEYSFGIERNLRSDIWCHSKKIDSVCLEIMWRKSTSRAEIAEYSLQKIANYAKAIGLL